MTIHLKVVLIFIWLAISFTLGFILSLFRWGDPNLMHDFARLFGWGALRIADIEIKVEGAEHLESPQPCIYAANHQSGFDVATFGKIFPKRTIVIGKKELLWIPFFGIFFKAAGNILIDRKKRDQAITGLNAAIEAVRRRKICIGIFPEGTRNRTGKGLLPFKKGGFHMAIEAQVPIVPMVSAPLSHVLDSKTGRFGGTLTFRILPPISTQGMTIAQVNDLCHRTREQMLKAYNELSVKCERSP